jgi:hypothetical protein
MRVWLMVFAALIVCCPVHAADSQPGAACPAHAQQQKAPDPGAHGCCDRTAQITSTTHGPEAPTEILSWLTILSSDNPVAYDFSGLSTPSDSNVFPLPSVLRI